MFPVPTASQSPSFGHLSSSQSSKIRKVLQSDNSRAYKAKSLSESVVACEFIEKGSLSDSYQTENLISHLPCGKLTVRKVSRGLIRPVEKIASWIRNIKLSPDVYSYNTLVELNEEKSVILRTCKDIVPEEELIMWFSEEIALLMDIPFLTPANIIDNKCYSCHLCNTSFESPNPLKIHLAASCDRNHINTLWMKLHYNLINSTTYLINQNKTDQLPSTSAHQNIRSSPLMPIVPSEFSFLPLTHNAIVQPISDLTTNTAAQIETLVSNMGTSKQGHLCIYCGKIYSRKYGLKIHIRTHTGFKPLKCKFCLRPFGDPSNLNKHVRLHIQAGNSVFKCHLCQKVLARKRDLQRHLYTRHNDQRFIKLQEIGSSSEDY